MGANNSRKRKIIIIGLDSVGKTTLLYKINNGKNEIVYSIPTIGFNVESVDHEFDDFNIDVNITCWDVGGEDKIRGLFRYYYENMDGLILVVDSNDKDRLEEIKYELQITSNEEQTKNCPILIFANKQDLFGSYTVDELIEKLELNNLNQVWNCIPCCATKGEGLTEGFNWLNNVLENNINNNNNNNNNNK
eukprot:TRINITY_DN4984_c5_g1_i2.p1 TRINITY_DN4984_c5_g1~~TRINITY_DN4984_c5_g1_i2.p1  ORF type:complete len:191 (-),score=49.60 TRINITY_DN4984_c5_g1_i2:210-782(-)